MIDQLTLTPKFPPFQGPLSVGSTILEIPVDEIRTSPAPREGISTIKAHIFYPTSTTNTAKSKPIWWLQEPQNESLAAYGRFLGASERLARAISHMPSFIKRTRIPAIADAPLLEPQTEVGWPLAIFSHGLGGSFNTYSYLCGSLASCGIVVVAIEHRDGSAPLSLVKAANGSVTSVDYKRLAHEPTPEVLDARNEQLKLRLWELDMLYSVIEALNEGRSFTNLADQDSRADTVEIPVLFTSKLDLKPSRVVWIGHSFGAATMVQFLKSTYWSRTAPVTDSDSAASHVLYTPAANGKLASQVTAKSLMVLLDMWTMPLSAEKAKWLYDRPLPYMDDRNPTSSTVLSVMSEQFYKWRDLLERTKHVLSGEPQQVEVKLKDGKSNYGPRLFYVKQSAHLNHSDFGVLFPWTTKRFMGADEPERIMNLNLRAILQLLRENLIPVAPIKICPADVKHHLDKVEEDNDTDILAKENDAVRNWTAIPLDV